MRRLVVFGTHGQLAKSLQTLLPAARFVSRAEADFSRPETLGALLDRFDPELIINPAAYTEVDRAESERELALRINAAAPGALAAWCAARGRSLIHYSTDYVYPGDGDQAWTETAPVKPVNVYGQTKYEGEAAISASGCHHLILRTSWVYSATGKNFLQTMLRLGAERERLDVVDDQIGAPTLARDLAAVTLRVIEHPAFARTSGVFNAVNAGSTSWFGFAEEIFRLARLAKLPLRLRELEPIASAQFPVPAVRPLNSRLSTEKLRNTFGVSLRPWQDALATCFKDLAPLGPGRPPGTNETTARSRP